MNDNLTVMTGLHAYMLRCFKIMIPYMYLAIWHVGTEVGT